MPKTIDQDTILGEVLHEWTVEEYEQHFRGLPWYVVMFLLGLALVFYGVFTGNFLFSLIIILFAIIIFLESHQAPSQVRFQITELGIVLGNRFYSFSEFSDFYLIYNPPQVKTLYLETHSAWRPKLRIPLLDKNPIEVKHSLREFLKEDISKEEEPLSDRAARNWKLH